jgi:glycosyltransferase involved in cell wall biosynthesis/SAM-dependent methyltransferase
MSRADSGRTALILVRNTVTHDARVHREAETLIRLGYRVVIAGVVSSEERDAQTRLAGADVVRLDPAATVRRALRRGSAPAARRSVGTQRWEPTTAARIPWRARPRHRLVRPGLAAAFYAQAAALGRRLAPTLVHANDYNTMWAGIACKLMCGSKLIYDSHELWPDRNGRPEWRPWLIWSEALFVRVADTTITTSPGYATAISRRYRVPEPEVIRNIADAPATVTRTPGGDPLCVYVGGLMPGRGLEPAIDALAAVPGLRMRLIGPGRPEYMASLAERSNAAGVAERVVIEAPVAPLEVVRALADADFGLMLIQPICRSYELTLPNKLFEYAAAELPILASDLEVIGPLVREHGLGDVVEVDDTRAIAAAMAKLLESEHNSQVRARLASFAANNTWEQERERLAALYGAGRVERAYAHYRASARKRHSWSADNPGNLAIRAELFERAWAVAGGELGRADAVLDIGCGTGWWLAALAAEPRAHADLYGVELLSARADAAQLRVPEAEIATADARRLPFDDHRFDVVSLFTALSSLERAGDVGLVVAEARRVLARDGALLIWEPRVPNPRNRATLHVSGQTLSRALSGMVVEVDSITLVPAIARALGSRAPDLYPRLAGLPMLRTHRLVCARPR